MYKSIKVTRALACLILLGFNISLCAEEHNPERGLAIAMERKSRDVGWQDSEARLTMLLRTAQGAESARAIRTTTLEVVDDGDKSLTIFDEPRDVRGTAFLNHSHILGADDQWLYLPAMRRTKRISSRNQSGPFMGSEFSYEDLSSFEVGKYHFRYIRDEEVNGEMCYVVEQIPVDEFSGYSKNIVWIDQQHYRLQKAEFYDRRETLLKTLVAENYQQYLDKYWRPLKLTMQNHQTGKSTDLIVDEIAFRVGRSESDFSTNALQRAR